MVLGASRKAQKPLVNPQAQRFFDLLDGFAEDWDPNGQPFRNAVTQAEVNAAMREVK